MSLNSSLEVWPYVEPPTILPYDFEKFDAIKWRTWMAQSWPISLVISASYVTLILVGQRFMHSRQPFKLQGPLLIWNLGLAIFSLCGFVRTFPELFQVISGQDGMHRSICVR